MTFAVVDKMADGNYVVKALKQKQMVDGLCYLLQEIYGIENKNTESVKVMFSTRRPVDTCVSSCLI